MSGRKKDGGTQANSLRSMQNNSFYAPYRILGLICDTANPCGFCHPYVYRRGDRTFLLVPIDACRALHLYDSRLRLISTSKPIPEEWWQLGKSSFISSVVNYKRNTFVAIGNTVGVLHDMQPLLLQRPVHRQEISHMLMLNKILVTVSAKECRLITWDMAHPHQPKALSELALPPDLRVTAVLHPDTYHNKILLGFSEGGLHLYNVNTRKLVYKFKSLGSRVVAIAQSSQIDVVGIGCENGSLVLLNLRVDEVINTFKHDRAAIQTIDFRKDGVETVVTTTSTGNLVIWDLNEACVCAVVKNVHPRGASLARFISGEPILITAGISDNAIKTHIFDGLAPSPRVLHARAGHTLPPTRIEFGHMADIVVTAGLDRQVRLVSRFGHWGVRALSQRMVSESGRRAKKRKRVREGFELGDVGSGGEGIRLPPVSALAVGNTHAHDESFANIATCHHGTHLVYTWRSDGGGLHRNVLMRPCNDNKRHVAAKDLMASPCSNLRRPLAVDIQASSVVISPCGNHAMVGYDDGEVCKFSLQSGEYVSRFTRNAKGHQDGAHDGYISALAISADGDILISGSSRDKYLHLWDVNTRKLIHSIDLPFNVALLALSNSSDLVAVGLADFSIAVYDVQARNLVRRFAGHTGRLTDLLFDSSGRCLLSSGMDGAIKTWDMVAGRCLDVVACKNAPTSLALAPTSDFLVSTHVNQVGVVSWIDRSKFVSTVVGNVRFPDSTVINRSAVHGKKADFELERNSLISLSTRPSTAWTTLANLDELKRRNKPIEPVTKPKQAPFFLPTAKSIAAGLGLVEGGSEGETWQRKQRQKRNQGQTSSDSTKFASLALKGDIDAAQKYIESLGPSAVDFELRMVNGLQAIEAVANYFVVRLGKRSNWELLQAHLGVFLAEHGMELATSLKGQEHLKALNAEHSNVWCALRHSFEAIDTLAAFFTGQR